MLFIHVNIQLHEVKIWLFVSFILLHKWTINILKAYGKITNVTKSVLPSSMQDLTQPGSPLSPRKKSTGHTAEVITIANTGPQKHFVSLGKLTHPFANSFGAKKHFSRKHFWEIKRWNTLRPNTFGFGGGDRPKCKLRYSQWINVPLKNNQNYLWVTLKRNYSPYYSMTR